MADLKYTNKSTRGIDYLEIKTFNLTNNDVLIIVPGTGLFKENYLHFANNLKSKYKIICIISLPQQGSEGKWRIGNMVDTITTIVQLYEDNGFSCFNMVGHSIGASSLIYYQLRFSSKIEEFLLKNKELIFNNIFSKQNIGSNNFEEFIKEFLELLEKHFFKVNLKSLHLFGVPDIIDNAFPKKIANKIKLMPFRKVRLILNLIVNYPMVFLNIFNKKIVPFDKKQILKEKIQFFSLELSSNEDFMSYVSSVIDFPIYIKFLVWIKWYIENSDSFCKSNTYLIDKVLNTIEISNSHIHYSKLDWIIRTWGKREKEYKNSFSNFKNVKYYVYKNLGHKFRRSFSLDFNMTSQMLLNKKAIKHIL